MKSWEVCVFLIWVEVCMCDHRQLTLSPYAIVAQQETWIKKSEPHLKPDAASKLSFSWYTNPSKNLVSFYCHLKTGENVTPTRQI